MNKSGMHFFFFIIVLLRSIHFCRSDLDYNDKNTTCVIRAGSKRMDSKNHIVCLIEDEINLHNLKLFSACWNDWTLSGYCGWLDEWMSFP